MIRAAGLCTIGTLVDGTTVPCANPECDERGYVTVRYDHFTDGERLLVACLEHALEAVEELVELAHHGETIIANDDGTLRGPQG
jgi:hypothetical protein